MSFSEVEAPGCNVGSNVGMGSATLGHSAPTFGHGAKAIERLSASGLSHAKPSIGASLKLPVLSSATHSINQTLPSSQCPVSTGLGQTPAVASSVDAGGIPNQSALPTTPSSLSSSLLSPLSSTSSSSSSSSSPPSASTASSGFQASSSPLTSSSAVNFPVSRPGIATMRGIGGFASPTLSPPPVVTSNSIASTLGNPQMPSVTYFNSRAPMGFNFRMAGSPLAGMPVVYKRKPEDEPEEIKPATKQHISEERMAAHLNSLHLSESYCNHKLGKRGWPERKEVTADMDEDQGLGEDEQGIPAPELSKDTARLFIADEVHQIIPGESQLPPQLLKKLTQPKMEVVLWQPPGNVIRNLITSSVEQQLSIAKATKPRDESASASITASLPSSEPSKPPAPAGDSSNSSSPDSGVSVTSPPPSLCFSNPSEASGASSSFTSSASSDIDDLLSLPSTSSGSRGGYLPPLRRPPSPLPDPMMDDDFSERMEFNNNNDNAPNYMWLEENNNSALIDLNAIEPHRAPHLQDLPDLPDSDDMDL